MLSSRKKFTKKEAVKMNHPFSFAGAEYSSGWNFLLQALGAAAMGAIFMAVLMLLV